MNIDTLKLRHRKGFSSLISAIVIGLVLASTVSTVVAADATLLPEDATKRVLVPKVAVSSEWRTNLEFNDKFFDIILMHHIIEHIKNDVGVLKECHRVLKDDGYLIIGTPNEGGLIGRFLRVVNKKSYDDFEHVNFYTPKSMERLLNQNGFVCYENKGVGLLFPYFPVHYKILRNIP